MAWPDQPADVKLVQLLSRTPLEGEALKCVRRLLDDEPIDWGSVLHNASDMDVDALVFFNVRALLLDAVPPAWRDEIVQRERESRGLAIRGSLLTLEASRMLETAGIPSIVMKGAAIGVVAYGDPSLRSFSDIDLLVKRGDVERARDVVLENGYTRDYEASREGRLLGDEHALEFSSTKTKLELHVALLSKHLSFSISEQDLWQSAWDVDFSGHTIQVLSRAHLLVFLCAHAAKHQWSNFKWVVDVAQLARQMDETEMGEAERIGLASGARTILETGLNAARNLDHAHAGLVDGAAAPTSLHYELGRIHHALPDLAYWAGTRERVSDRIYPFLRLAMRRIFRS